MERRAERQWRLGKRAIREWAAPAGSGRCGACAGRARQRLRGGSSYDRPVTERDTTWPRGVVPTRYASLEEFLNRDYRAQGDLEILHGRRPLHVRWQDRGSDTTLVIFSAAVARAVTTVPIYSGRGSTAELDANVLMISDPALKRSQKLRLGWYAGSRDHPHAQRDIGRIVTSLAGDSRIVLFGGSGGGYAALEQALRLPGATVLVSNPQTNIERYDQLAIDLYLKLAWGRTTFDGIPIRRSVVEDYSRPVDANVVYIQNLGDTHHVNEHRRPFLESLHHTNRVHLITPSFGDGHIGPGNKCFSELFTLMTSEADWARLTARLDTTPIYR